MLEKESKINRNAINFRLLSRGENKLEKNK